MISRALGYAKTASRYQGDLNEIALFPYNGLSTNQRVSLLEDHYRRTAYQPPLNPALSVGKSALKGALLAGSAVAVRQFGYNRQAGTGVMKSIAEALRVARWPAPLIGATIAAPFGAIPFVRDQIRRRRASSILSMPASQRDALLRQQVATALR
jgi:hypothetical protein